MRVNVVIVEAFFDCYIATLRNEIHRTSSPFNSLLSIRLSRRKSLEYCVIQGTFHRSFSFFFPSQSNTTDSYERFAHADGRDTYFSNDFQTILYLYTRLKRCACEKKSEDFEIDGKSIDCLELDLRVSNNNFLKYELHQFLRELIRINFCTH